MSTKLALLGILCDAKKPMYGYEIKKLMKEWNIAEYAKISYGSIYYNLERMEKDGLVKGKTVRNGKQPERRLYSVTEKGEAELMKLLRKNYSEIERSYYPFDIGVSLMWLLPKDEVIKALEKRIQIEEECIEMLHKEKAELQSKIPFFSLSIFDHYLYHFEAEKKWLKELKKEVKKRKSYFEDFKPEEKA